MSHQVSRSGGSHCCTNRDPPSPDSGPPRPSVSFSEATDLPDRDKLSSYSTEEAEAAVLRAIFEGDEANGLETAPIKHSSFHKLGTLLTGSRSNISEEGVHRDVKEKRSSSTLNSVTQKLKKHLSIESALSKRRSRSSVRTSDEADRRAELRRIRNQRIQEELSNETSYDSDAKSLSPISDANTPLEKTAQSSMRAWAPCDVSPLPPLLSCSSQYPELPFNELLYSGEQNSTLLAPVRNTIEGTETPALPRSSPIESDKEEVTFGLWPKLCQHTREFSDIPPIPPAPVLQPKRLPSITEPPKSSWRLSFASSNRGEVLRSLSLAHDTADAVNLEQWDSSTQALRKWLHNQKVRSPLSNIANPDNKTNFGSLACHSQTFTDDQDVRGDDDRAEHDPSTIHIHEMRISQRLASSDPRASSSPHFSSWSSHVRHVPSISDASQIERAHRSRKSSDSVSLAEEITQLWDQIMEDGSLPSCSPTGIEPQTNIDAFHSDIVTPSHETKPKAGSSRLKRVDSVGTKTGPRIFATFSDHSLSQQQPLARPAERPTVDNSLILASETKSFRGPEAEPSIIKNRFLFRKAKIDSDTPVSSQFKLDFNSNLQPPKPWTPHTPSIFTRLSKLITRYYDGRTAVGESVSPPIPTSAPADLMESKTCGSEPKRGRGGWGIRSENPRKGVEDDEESRIKSLLGGLSSMAWAWKKKKNEIDIDNAKMSPKGPRRHSEECTTEEELADSTWVQRVSDADMGFKADKEKVVKKRKTVGPDLRFPEAWASYPSHSRRERNASAGWPDSIHARDFALKTSDNEDYYCSLHRKGRRAPQHDGSSSPLGGDSTIIVDGLVEEMEQDPKAEINRLEMAEDHPDINHSSRGRDSHHCSELDYPQLSRLERLLKEALPMKDTTATQIAKSIIDELAEQRRRDDSLIEQLKADMVLPEIGIRAVGGDLGLRAGGTPLKESVINIGDPTFYEDCVADNDTNVTKQKSSERVKSMTCIRYDLESQQISGDRRKESISLGSMVLRKSTDEYHSELEIMEKVERENVLRAVEEAWG